MDDKARTPREPEEQAAKDGEYQEEPKRQKDRLKDLDVTDDDGNKVKGGVPTIVDGSPRR